MQIIRRAILALALMAGLAPAFAQAPPPVPALPDNERRTTYSITLSTCACAINMALYGDSTDYQNWIEVWLNGVRLNYNDPSFGWTITSPTGPLATIPRPITDAVLTFNSVQTGTIQIVGARRPRRITQFSENRGVAARDLNQAMTDLVAMLRENWDKTNDVSGRAVLARPGETLALLPILANRLNQGACFDGSGNLTTCVSVPSSTFSAGSGIQFTGTNPTIISTQTFTAGSGITFTGTNPVTISAAGNGQGSANISGSASSTTGTISATSTSLTLASALDFKNGHGIRINHAGTATGLGAPSSLTVTPTGTTGSTTYTYTVAPFTATGGYGPAITNVTTSTGNATLSATNYNALSWSAASGAVGYAVYGNVSGSMTLLAFVPGTTFFDVGTSNFASEGAPDWIPGTPPASGAANWLVTSVSSGGGTTSLTLAATATTSATSQGVFHDDTVALQAALTSAISNNQPLNLGSGIYRITSALTGTGSLQIYGNGPDIGVSPGNIILTSPTQDGLDLTGNYIVLHDFGFEGGSGSASGQVAGNAINFPSSVGGIWISRIVMQYCFNGVSGVGPGPFYMSNNLLSGYGSLINMTTMGDSTIEGSQLSPISLPGATSASGIFLNGDPGGVRIINNKINAGGFGYAAGVSVTATISDGDLMIVGNSIEQFNLAGIILDRTGSTAFGNVSINSNQMTGVGRGVYFPNTTAGWLSNITINDNIMNATINDITIVASNKFNISGNNLEGPGTGIFVGSAATGCGIGFNSFNGPSIQIQDNSAACTYAAITTTKPTYP